MKTTGILKDEHRVIEHVLGALEIQAARLQSGAAVRAEFFLEAIVFLRDFTGERRQRKEEETLFVALIDAGAAKDNGPIAEMLAEHAQARELIQKIERQARIVQGGGTNAGADLARNTAGYVALLTRHIQKEEMEIFPAAESRIPDGVKAELDAEFERIESGYVEAGVHDTYYGLAEKLGNEAAG